MAAACPDANAPLLAEAADAIEQHEAFKQEVSDECTWIFAYSSTRTIREHLSRFIIPKPKPDPLADVWKSMFPNGDCGNCMDANQLRAALDARGLEIRSKNDD
jgi:hypothetical protein